MARRRWPSLRRASIRRAKKRKSLHSGFRCDCLISDTDYVSVLGTTADTYKTFLSTPTQEFTKKSAHTGGGKLRRGIRVPTSHSCNFQRLGIGTFPIYRHGLWNWRDMSHIRGILQSHCAPWLASAISRVAAAATAAAPTAAHNRCRWLQQ